MTQPAAGLRPLTGSPREVRSLVAEWLDDGSGEPLWVRTSGSSGEPKDVMLSSAALRASATAAVDRLGGPGRWTLALPAHYVAGLQVVVRSILAGSHPVRLDEHPSLAAATAAHAHGTRRYISVVPTQLHRWLDEPDELGALASYDAVLVGGSAASAADVDAARAAGVHVVLTYGMSETCGGCVYDGLPLDGVAVALAADGRVRLAGAVLFDGYAGRDDLTADVLDGGWLTTADVGEFDDDGLLRILGRVDDVVVTGGVNVPVGAVESVVAGLPGVAACVVVGRPDAEWGSVVCAVVEQRPDTVGISLEAVRDAVAARHPRAWAPRDLIVVDALPLLESGKVDRRAVEASLSVAHG